MAKNKLEKIAEVEAEIRQLNERVKILKQQHNADERKARNHRLCKRGGLVEKLLPELITFSDTQFENFVGKTLLTSHTKRIIAEIQAQAPAPKTGPQGEKTAEQASEPTTAKPTQPPQGGGAAPAARTPEAVRQGA